MYRKENYFIQDISSTSHGKSKSHGIGTKDNINPNAKKSIGIDPGFGLSKATPPTYGQKWKIQKKQIRRNSRSLLGIKLD